MTICYRIGQKVLDNVVAGLLESACIYRCRVFIPMPRLTPRLRSRYRYCHPRKVSTVLNHVSSLYLIGTVHRKGLTNPRKGLVLAPVPSTSKLVPAGRGIQLFNMYSVLYSAVHIIPLTIACGSRCVPTMHI